MSTQVIKCGTVECMYLGGVLDGRLIPLPAV